MTDPLSLTVAQVEALPEDKAAEVLAAWVKAKKPALAEALAQSNSKAHAKLAKKALYQLESSGTSVSRPTQAAPQASAPVAEKEDENLLGTMTPVLGTGDRALFFARPLKGGGIEIYQAIISDEFGVVQFDRAQTNRGVYRSRIKELRAQRELSILFVPLARIIEELGKAMTLNDRSRTNIPSEMADGLTRLGVVPLDPDWKVPAPEAGDAALVAQSAKLHDEPELKQWMPPEKELSAMSELAGEVKGDLAKGEVKAAEFATTFFTEAMRQTYARRLWLNAEFFDASNRTEQATRARATARQLFSAPQLPPFCTKLFLKAFELAAPKPDQAEKIKELLASMPSVNRLGGPPTER